MVAHPIGRRSPFPPAVVYAVAMRTIRTFKRALGRLVHWSQLPVEGTFQTVGYERRLKLCLHYFREANAYCSPRSRAFTSVYLATPKPPPGNPVFTCLSQDSLPTNSHALLYGMGVRPMRRTNLDVFAFTRRSPI